MPEDWNYSAKIQGSPSISHISVFMALNSQADWCGSPQRTAQGQALHSVLHVSTRKLRGGAHQNRSRDFQQQECSERNSNPLILHGELCWAGQSQENYSCAHDGWSIVHVIKSTHICRGSKIPPVHNCAVLLVSWTSTWWQLPFLSLQATNGFRIQPPAMH